MSDDLVKRLRTPVGFQDLPFIQEEAADRIEALEAQLAEYKMVARTVDDEWCASEDEVDRLKAQLAAFQWQPIETAPREDTQAVLVLTPEGMEVAWWCAHQNEFLTTDGKYIWGAPTHWMPLPEPPKAD